jgi:ankyrin repeat protein
VKQAFFLFFMLGHSLYGMHHFTNSPLELPLHLAAQNNNCEKIIDLISLGAQVNAKNSDENTALHAAIAYGSKEATKLLIYHKADINESDYTGNSPLHLALRLYSVGMFFDTPSESFFDIVHLLINAGADINQLNHALQNPLAYHLSQSTNPATLEKSVGLLIAKGSYTKKKAGKVIFYDPSTTLHGTILPSGFVAKHIILAGHPPLGSMSIDITSNEQDDIGATALMYYAAQGDIEGVKNQLNAKTNPLLEDMYGRNVFTIIEIILNNKDDSELTLEQQATYHKIMHLCYKSFAKNIWCIYSTYPTGLIKKSKTLLSTLPLDILKVIMFFATGTPHHKGISYSL